VAIERAEPGPIGADAVTFTFAPNPGEPPRPLGRIASGGEASRLSLALKVVLAGADETPLLVFDEVDAGVGGRNAAAVGERLRALSAYHQVLCVTHLPQVAACGDAQWSVTKSSARGSVRVQAARLDPAARIEEIARMLGGSAGTARKHAAELLESR
jgi:DNA repair protein RecN (Recombination protein N)